MVVIHMLMCNVWMDFVRYISTKSFMPVHAGVSLRRCVLQSNAVTLALYLTFRTALRLATLRLPCSEQFEQVHHFVDRLCGIISLNHLLRNIITQTYMQLLRLGHSN